MSRKSNAIINQCISDISLSAGVVLILHKNQNRDGPELAIGEVRVTAILIACKTSYCRMSLQCKVLPHH